MAGERKQMPKKKAETKKKRKKTTVDDIPGTGLAKRAGQAFVNRHKLLKSL